MAKITDETTLDGIWLGSKWNDKRAIINIPAGGAEEAGLLFLEAVDGSGTLQDGVYLWGDSSGNLRYSTTRPTDEDSDGYALDNTTIGAAANKQLDNLASVAIPCDIASDTNSTDNLGTSSIYWQYSYIDRMYVNGTAYIDGAIAGELALIGNVDIGESGTGKDVNFFGADYDMVWDASESDLTLNDNTELHIGTGSDIVVKHDGTDTHIDGGAANEILRIGDGTTIDLYLHGANDDIHFDASADLLRLTDTFILGFGTGGSTDYDIGFAYAAAGHLDITQKVGGTGDIQVGEDGKGIDVKFFAETTSDYMLWDQDGASNVGALTLVDSALIFDQATVDYTLQATTNALLLSATDNASAEFTLGSTGTHGMDVTFQGADSGDHVKFVATGTWTYTDVPVTLTGADSSGTLLAITGIDTTGDSDTVTIDHSGAGAALYIDLNEADSTGIELEAYTNQTTSGLVLDGTTAGWYGANDVGFLHIKNDITLANAGASLFYITESGTPKASSEGFLARFVHTGTATATATAVEIEVPATQPALATNGKVTITGQDAQDSAVLAVTGNDASNDVNAVTINNEGSDYALLVTGDDTDSGCIKTTGVTSQTASQIYLDGTTGDGGFVGAAGIGMLALKQDGGTLADATASLIHVNFDGTAAASHKGTCLHIDDDAAGGSGYAAYISAAGNVEALHVDDGAVLFDEKVTTTGMFFTPTDMTATDAGATIAAGVSYVTADETTGDDGDILTLPTAVAGQMLIVFNDDAAQDFELTAAASDTINGGSAAGAVTVGEDECVFLFAVDTADWRAFKVSGNGTLATAGQSSA